MNELNEQISEDRVSTIYDLNRLLSILKNTVILFRKDAAYLPKFHQEYATITAIEHFNSAATRQADLRKTFSSLSDLFDLDKAVPQDVEAIRRLYALVMFEYTHATDESKSDNAGRVHLPIWNCPKACARHKKIKTRRNIHVGHYTTLNDENKHLRDQQSLLLVGNFDGTNYMFTGEYFTLAFERSFALSIQDAIKYAIEKYGLIIESSADTIADFIKSDSSIPDQIRLPVNKSRIEGISAYSHIGTPSGKKWLDELSRK